MELNQAVVFEAIATAVGDRPAIIAPARTSSYADLAERSRRLANHLAAFGLGAHRERGELAPWASGQDHLALCLRNGPEYLEAMLGAFRARVAPCNVNHRYGPAELVALLHDIDARALAYHSAFAPLVDAARAHLPRLRVLLQVADGSAHGLLPGAEWYEDALAAASDRQPEPVPSADDLYLLCTGGTTRRPRTVLWRQADVVPAAFGGREPGSGREWGDLGQLVDNARHGEGTRLATPAPFTHGAAHWMALAALNGGHTVVIPPDDGPLDPAAVWRTVARHEVNILLIVGDAFARPLLDELEAGRYDVTSLRTVVSGGAPLGGASRARLLAGHPTVAFLDGLGSSETGPQASQVSTAGSIAPVGAFRPNPGARLVSEDRARILGPGTSDVGWLAQAGRIPLGYLGDPGATRASFPIIDGQRLALSGDRGRLGVDGRLELLGRDATTVNTGGEKVFVEEVEAVLARHPAVADVVVTGRPSPRWGEELVALVQPRPGADLDPAAVLAAAGAALARYKVPKAVVVVDAVARGPAGKLDRRWARQHARQAADQLAPGGGVRPAQPA